MNVQKQFPFPNIDFSTSSKALMGCEVYCSNQKDCWGCSIHCTNTSECQWNAIPDCGELQEWEGFMNGDVSQKPSR